MTRADQRSTEPVSGATRAGLIVVLLVAAVVRLLDLQNVEFRLDSAYWAHDALEMLRGGPWPLLGQQVGSVRTELHNGPLLSYLTALVFAVAGPRPEAVSAVIGLLNVVGVWLTFKLGVELFSARVGLLAAGLMAVAPWFVLFSRMLWPQSLLPFTAPAALLCLVRARTSDRPVSWCFCGVFLGLSLQLHLSTLALIGTLVLFVLIYGTARVRAMLLIGVGLVAGYAPVIVHDVLHGFTTLTAFSQLSSLHAVEDSRVVHAAKAVWNFSNVLSGQGLWVSKIAYRATELPIWMEWGVGLLFSAAMIVAASATARRWYAGRTSSWRPPWQEGLVVLLSLVPLGYLALSRSAVERHYFIFFYPAPFLWLAYEFDRWRALGSRSRGRVLAAAFAAAIVLNLTTIAAAGMFIHRTGGVAGYGTVLADKEGAVASVLADSNGAFEVELHATQEPQPYMFLFERDRSVSTRGSEQATIVTSAATVPERARYRIVETPYHALDFTLGTREIFRSRGVVVLRVTTGP